MCAFLITYLENTHLTYWHSFDILGVQKELHKIFQKGAHLSSAHNNMLFVVLWSQCAIGTCMGGTILYTENNFHESWKMYNWKTTKFCIFVLECIITSFDLSFSHQNFSHFIEIPFGFILGTKSQHLFSANTICIVHPSTQPIHTKTGPIAAPWCRVLTQAWHILLPKYIMLLFKQRLTKHYSVSCYMALPRSNKLNILIKYFQLLGSGVEFFNSMWLKNI